MSHILNVSHLHHKFDSRELFYGLDFKLEKSKILAIVGPSGCGKSTLLRLLAGLIPASKGEIHWQEELKSNLSFVFQEARLLPWKNALENTLLPFQLFAKNTNSQQQQMAEERLKQMGLHQAFHLYPKQLSGGMKMRVSLARALVTNPKVLFLDEPFAALDEQTRESLQLTLRAQAETEKLNVILVTHSLSEALFLADRILLLDKNGKLQKDFNSPNTSEWQSPRNKKLKDSESFFSALRNLQISFREVVNS